MDPLSSLLSDHGESQVALLGGGFVVSSDVGSVQGTPLRNVEVFTDMMVHDSEVRESSSSCVQVVLHLVKSDLSSSVSTWNATGQNSVVSVAVTDPTDGRQSEAVRDSGSREGVERNKGSAGVVEVTVVVGGSLLVLTHHKPDGVGVVDLVPTEELTHLSVVALLALGEQQLIIVSDVSVPLGAEDAGVEVESQRLGFSGAGHV